MTRRQFLAASLALARSVRAGTDGAEFLGYDRAVAVLNACRLPLPADYSGWTAWIEGRDHQIRARLARGEEDSLVNFLLFGVSFTRQPRATGENPDSRLLQERVRDLIRGFQAPGKNERLVWLRDLAGRHGYRTATPQEREHLARYMSENISRYLAERSQFRRVLETASANDPVTAELYKNRGLSLDTDFRPGYAVDVTLADLQKGGVLRSVERVAVIGPGLDFTDKDNGFDYYPLQTLQPFALIDSLLRLGLAQMPHLHVSVFDISTQVLDHLSRARRPYTVQLVLDESRHWNADVLEYWRQFGDRVGAPVQPLRPPPQVQHVRSRAIRIHPEVVAALEPRDLNAVLQHLALPADRQYDLIVATNVFVYYDEVERALSLLNLKAMLRPGGIFLSNTEMPECSGETLHAIGNREVRYSQETDDGDRMEIYSNAPLRRGLGPQ